MISSKFQSTPPARGATKSASRWLMPMTRFQSTPPARGATPRARYCPICRVISIHAPREGGDTLPTSAASYCNISIHAPREGGDPVGILVCDLLLISIHAPREGGDAPDVILAYPALYISIHAPREGGDGGSANNTHCGIISIHAPREGGDYGGLGQSLRVHKFQSTPPARGATLSRPLALTPMPIFQSTPPARGATLASRASCITL